MKRSKIGLWLGLGGVLFSGCQSKEDLTFEQYKINGEEIYLQQCANCHQADGSGLRGVIPPLKEADYLNSENLERVICLIKNGVEGPLVVNGVTYSQAMPAHASLQPLDIAAVTTYIYSKWGGLDRRIRVMEVDSALLSCRSPLGLSN